ncbi:nucleotide pyrophosphohydrolase [Neorhodopirellula lusitana]|uniref:nucleotide pyrophosphohydrolase n=1 Tax=Neorhodopirellula lusitana TaxID=445327 RepID=UPI00384B5101
MNSQATPAAPNPTSEPPLTIADVQATVDQWIQTIGVRYFDEMTNLAQLVEEVGEVARILSRTRGEQSCKQGVTPESLADQLPDELADVLFVVICLANQSGIDLTEALRRNLDKKTKRDATRHHNNAKLKGELNSEPKSGTPDEA